MRRIISGVYPLLSLSLLAVIAPPATPPVAPVKPVTDNYFGTKIVDPYRWMEDAPNPALTAWMKAQNDYTRSVLDSIPGRAALLTQLQAASRGTYVDGMQVAGKRVFFTMSTNGGTAKLYYRQGNANRLIFDPQRGEPPDRIGAIEYFSPSANGKYVAVGVSINGAELNTTIRIIETATGRDLGDRITRAPGALPYWVENKGFFYSRLPAQAPGANPSEAQERQQVFFHRLGQAADSEKPSFGYGIVGGIAPVEGSAVYIASGSSYAIGVVANGVDNVARFYAAPLAAAIGGTAAWRLRGKAFLDTDAGSVDEPGLMDVAMHGDTLYVIRFDPSHRTEVVALNLRHGGTLKDAGIVIGASIEVHRSVTAAADGLYVWSSSGGLSHLTRVDYKSDATHDVRLPYPGSLSEPATDVTEPGAVFGLTAWTRPLQYFAYQPAPNRVTPSGVGETTSVDVRSYSASEVTAISKDGTKVPLSILRPKNSALDGSHPAILVGYGSYGVALDAGFDPTTIPWLERGGVYAIAHVRGGGEFGEPWHLAGKGSQKQHTIDDFIACAEYLIAKGYTSRAKLAGWGASAGGIAIGNALVQRPNLFAVAIVRVGATDMLRFETTPNGPSNVPEFGSVKTEQGFKDLYAMSAYNHVVDGTRYPATLLATGANDPRVAPWIVAKMAARLQAASTSGKPVLLRVDYAGGHGLDSTLAQFNELQADAWSFVLWQTGDPEFQPGTLSSP